MPHDNLIGTSFTNQVMYTNFQENRKCLWNREFHLNSVRCSDQRVGKPGWVSPMFWMRVWLAFGPLMTFWAYLSHISDEYVVNRARFPSSNCLSEPSIWGNIVFRQRFWNTSTISISIWVRDGYEWSYGSICNESIVLWRWLPTTLIAVVYSASIYDWCNVFIKIEVIVEGNSQQLEVWHLRNEIIIDFDQMHGHLIFHS